MRQALTLLTYQRSDATGNSYRLTRDREASTVTRWQPLPTIWQQGTQFRFQLAMHSALMRRKAHGRACIMTFRIRSYVLYVTYKSDIDSRILVLNREILYEPSAFFLKVE